MKTTRTAFHEGRKEQRTPERNEDSYRLDAKLSGPLCCSRCGASYRNGRWTWKIAAADVPRKKCPACQRIEDNFPAGYLTLKGAYAAEHRAELLELITGREAHARQEHPMQRIIGVEDTAQGLVVTTTDAHLARGLAVALHEAFKGTIDLDFAKDENFLRATWTR